MRIPRPRRRRPQLLPIRVFISAELLQRVEDAMRQAGLSSRSALVVSLLDRWCDSHEDH